MSCQTQTRRSLLIGAGASIIVPRPSRAWNFGLTPSPTIGLVTTGDSITGCSDDYPYQALVNPATGDCGTVPPQADQTYYSRATSVPIIWRNMGISGTRLNTNGYPDLVPLAASPYIKLIPSSSPFKGLKLIVTTGIGANDLFVGNFGNGNADQYAAAIAACIVSIKSAWTALGATCLGAICMGLPQDTALVESNWTQFNTTLNSAGWAAANGVDLIIQLGTGSIMGQWATAADPTYYNAGLHPTVLGHSLLAPDFLAGVNTLIGMF